MVKTTNKVFDYRAIRFTMGIIALLLPFVVKLLSQERLSSISASYHTEARDAFVGMLFVVGTFLSAYNGHSLAESLASKLAAIAAIFVAIFPTASDGCSQTVTSIVHSLSAIVLFSILAYFCFVPFQQGTKGQPGKRGRRSRIYLLCGAIMVVCMLTAAGSKLIPSDYENPTTLMFWTEAIALWAFGIAWIVSGKTIGLFVDKEEALKAFWK